MAMNPGTVNMLPGTMARELYTAMNTVFGAVSGEIDTDRRKLCVALATGIINHLKSQADVVIEPHHSGLQTAGGTPTGGPASTVTLSGALE